jgi:transposase
MGKFLDKTQRQKLEAELRRERGRKHADRIRVILLLDQGKTYASIAEYLFLDEGTIANYRRRYKDGGLEELLSDDYKGGASFLSLKSLVKLEIHLQESVYLSVKSMLEYVNRRFKVDYSLSGLTSLLHRMNYTYKKPKAVPGKAKIEDQKTFISRYKVLRREGKVYFGDAVHPHHNPVLGYGWIKKGVEMQVPTNPGRHHLNIVGALCLDGLEVITRNFTKVNGSSICSMLWAIRSKNPDYKERIYYVLDNAAYHRARKVKKLARKLRINLIYLPGYSPNLNPIERLWKFFKKKVMYNTYYPTFHEFKKAASGFFQGLRAHRDELAKLLTDNFQLLGT